MHDKGCICLITNDGTDFYIDEAGSFQYRLYLHKDQCTYPNWMDCLDKWTIHSRGQSISLYRVAKWLDHGEK